MTNKPCWYTWMLLDELSESLFTFWDVRAPFFLVALQTFTHLSMFLLLSSFITKSSSATFESSHEDHNRIPLKKKSLFGNLVSPTSISSKALDKRMEKEVFLHAVTLTDYLRVKRIPRCLRINKDHSIGKNNDTFCDCWSEILNKCSFDLTALNSQHIFCWFYYFLWGNNNTETSVVRRNPRFCQIQGTIWRLWTTQGSFGHRYSRI